MAQRQRRTKNKKNNRSLRWVSHLITFVFGAFTGILIAQVGFGTQQTTSSTAPVISPPPNTQVSTIQQLETHLTHAADNVDTRIRLGNAYFDSGNFQSAITHYARALEMNPGNPDVTVDLAIAYRRIGRSDVAVEIFNKALRLNPRHINARYNLGLVLKLDINDIQGAIAAWDTLLILHPNHPNADAVKADLADMRSGPNK
jgi:cytochrome c-type biogenesis protein CcmH/NrfG